jgi:MFS family permease
MNNPSIPEVGGRSAKFALILLVIVYVFNFIDRQILTILAEDLKADLNISDSDIGFLYGTAFAVFYSVVGIPMGKLADTWNRKNLISLGLAFWSLMTFLSGTAKSFLSLSIYRFGVGIGESSASPASYSLLSDYFSPKVRATVLSIYASGLYIGSGIGIFIGGLIVDNWNETFPIISEAPFGLKGWQVAFMAVGLPGILLALLTWQIKEPPRGLSEGLTETKKENPLKAAFGELVGLTPIGLLQAENTQKELLRNFALLIFVLSGAYWLIQTTGDYLQWIAFGIGFYIVCNWIQGLRIRDKVAFELMFKSKALLLGLLAFPFITFVTYALGAFGPAFYIRNFGMTASEVGVIYGLITAFGSMVGVIGGGFIGDKLREKYINGKLYLIMASALGTAVTGLGFLYSPEANVSFAWKFFYHVSSTAWLGCAASTVTELVLPRLRAVASAFFILMLSMGGLALGPYLTGMLSDIYTMQFLAEGVNKSMAEAIALKQALAQSLVVLLVPMLLLGFACRFLKKDEENLFIKARNLGEAI